MFGQQVPEGVMPRALSCAVLCVSALLFTTAATAQVSLDRNLIVNPGAESGEALAAIDSAPTASIQGWQKSGNLSIARYDRDNFVDISIYPGLKDQGEQYFTGGPGGGAARATQTIDLTALAADIDAGKLKFLFTGLLSASEAAAPASIKATFKDARGAVVFESTLRSGDWQKEQGGIQYILCRTATGWVLPNTRSVDLVLDLSGPASSFNPSMADRLELTLSAVPVLNSELVLNGDAEVHNYPAMVPGWNAPGSFGSEEYTNAEECFNGAEACIPRGNPGPSNRGRRFLVGPGEDDSSAGQMVDLTLVRDAIDAGGVGFAASAWLGGFNDVRDDVTLQLNFLDAGGRRLGGVSAGPVTPAERGGKSLLIEKKLTGRLPSGTRTLDIRLAYKRTSDRSFSANHGYTDNVSVTLSSGTQGIDIQSSRMFNAASLATGPVAPGEMIEIAANGVSLSGQTRMQMDAQGRVATELAGVRVFFDGAQMPLLYVNASRIGGIVPYDVAGQASSAVRLEYQGVKSNTVDVAVAKTAPGVFTQEAGGKGRAMIYGDTWTLNSAANAAAKGSVVSIIWTGGGQLNPVGVNGRMENGTLPRVVETVSVTIGGQTAEVLYSGAVPFGWSGLLMTQVRVPQAAASGDVPVVLTAGGTASQTGVTMAVR